MSELAFAWRLLRRDWRTGELRLLAVSLLVAVSAVTAVLFFTDRVQRAMELQAAELLAADLVVETADPLPPNLIAEAEGRGLASAHTLEFPSVVLDERGPQLVQVKAVGPGYPLRGELRISAQRQGPERVADAPPRQTPCGWSPDCWACCRPPPAIRCAWAKRRSASTA